jgi:hypothetical protein
MNSRKGHRSFSWRRNPKRAGPLSHFPKKGHFARSRLVTPKRHPRMETMKAATATQNTSQERPFVKIAITCIQGLYASYGEGDKIKFKGQNCPTTMECPSRTS